MDFTNTVIPVSGLPAIEEVVFQPLERDYLKVERIVYAITTIVVLALGIAAVYFVERLRMPLTLIISSSVFLLITILGWIGNSLGFRFSGYAIREKDVLYRSGWFIRKTRVVPLNRVQHVSMQSGPIERKYNLASVSIYTAGSEQADFTIRGINEQTASQIKEWISEQLNARNDPQ